MHYIVRNAKYSVFLRRIKLTNAPLFGRLYICKQRCDTMRIKIRLICEKCLSRNYTTYKHKDEQERMTIKKYCSRCKEHTMHKESK